MPGSTVWWPPGRDEQGEHEAGVLVFAPAAPLNFTNAERICGEIRSAIAARRQPVKLLVIEANGIIDIDYTGSQVLQRAIADLRAAGIVVAIARLSDEQAQRQAHRSGPDRNDRQGPCVHVGRGGGAKAGTPRRGPRRSVIERRFRRH